MMRLARSMLMSCCLAAALQAGIAAASGDYDGDGIVDEADNCPNDYNPDQADDDADGIGNECVTCTPLGRLVHYGLVTQKLRSRFNKAGGYGNTIDDNACVGSAKIENTDFQPDYSYGHLVATKASGTALVFRARTENQPVPETTRIFGNLVTGGGAIKGRPWDDGEQEGDYRLEEAGVIDTSGLHPEVALCQGALADMTTASEHFAALPPDRNLGNFLLARDADNLDIDLAPGEVVTIDSLVTEPVPLEYRNGYHQCDQSGPYITFSGGPAIVNIDRFEMQSCATLYASEGILFNLPGPGHAVRIGFETYVGVPILAPRRTVKMVGTDFDTTTYSGQIWAKKVDMLGISYVSMSNGISCGWAE